MVLSCSHGASFTLGDGMSHDGLAIYLLAHPALVFYQHLDLQCPLWTVLLGSAVNGF